MTTKNDVETFKHHALWASTDELIALASAAVSRTTTDRYTVARALAIAKYVKSFRPIETYLFPANRMSEADAIAGQIDSISTQLTGWDRAAAMIPQTIRAIDAGCDQVLGHLGTFNWPRGRRGTEGDGYFASAEAYRVAADRSLEGIDAKIAATQEHLAGLETQANTLAAESAARAREAEQSLLAIGALNELQTTNAERYLDEVLVKIRDMATHDRANLADKAATYLTSLEENYNSGNDLIRKVADRAVGGNYLDFAEHEKKAYGRWNAVAIGSAVLAFLYLAAEFTFRDLDVEGAVLRVGVSLTMVALSAYAFREAGKRQRQSVEARYRALDVIAMPPFSKGLSGPQSEKLRFLMGERLFGAHLDSAAGTNKSGEVMNFSLDPATAQVVADAIKVAKAAGVIP